MDPSRVSMTEPLPPNLLFFISSFRHLIPIKLNEQNYTIWKLQCDGALKASSLFAYVQESQAPSPTITDSTGTSIPNPAYFTWFVIESHLRSCLISTLTPSILAQVSHTSTALELCEFLKLKFTTSKSAGKISGELPSAGGRRSDNQSRRIAAPPISPMICRICANGGHSASHCCHRLVESQKPPDKAPHRNTTTPVSNSGSPSNANEVFDVIPNRELLAIADGSADFAGSDIVPLGHGKTMFFEPDMLVLNQSDSSFDERIPLSLEEMMGYQSPPGSGNLESLHSQQKPKPQISVAKNKVISKQAKPKTNPSGLKRKAPPPHSANGLSSVPLKKNTVQAKPNLSGSKLEAPKPHSATDLSSDPLKKNTMKVEPEKKLSESKRKSPTPHCADDLSLKKVTMQVDAEKNLSESKRKAPTPPRADDLSSDPLKKNAMQAEPKKNLSESKQEAATPHCAKSLSSDPLKKNTMVCFCSRCQNSRFKAREQNTVKNNDNGASSKETGNAIENTPGSQIRKIQNSQERKVGGNSMEVDRKSDGGKASDDQKIQNSPKRKLEAESLQVNKKLDAGNVVKPTVSASSQKIQSTQKRKLDGESLQVNKKLNAGNAIKPTGTANSQSSVKEVNKQLNGGNVIEIKTTADEQKILQTRESKLVNGGKSADVTGIAANSQKIQNSLKEKPETKSQIVNKQLSGGNAIEIKTNADEQKILKARESKLVNGGKSKDITGIAANQKVQNPQDRKSEENPLKVNKKLNGHNAVDLTGNIDHQKIQNSQETELEGSSVQAKKISNGGNAVELTRTIDDQNIKNAQERNLEGKSLQVGKKLNLRSVVVFPETDDYQTIQNRRRENWKRTQRELTKELNCSDAIGTAEYQKNRNSEERKLEGNSMEVNTSSNDSKTTADQKIQKPEVRNSEEKSLQANGKLNGSDAIELTGTADSQKSQNSEDRKLEGNSLEANKNLNGVKDTELTETAGVRDIQRKLEENSMQVDRKLNCGDAVDFPGTADHQMIQKLNGGDGPELTGATADQKIQNLQERKLEDNSMQVNKKPNGGSAIELTETSGVRNIQNPLERKMEENSMQVDKALNGGNAIELTGTADHQMIQKLNGSNGTELTGATADQKIQNSPAAKPEGKPLPVYKKVNGNTLVLVRPVADQKIQNPQAIISEENPSQAYKNTSDTLPYGNWGNGVPVNTMQRPYDADERNGFKYWCGTYQHMNGRRVDGDDTLMLMRTVADADQKIQNPQAIESEENPSQAYKNWSDNLPLGNWGNGVPVNTLQRPNDGYPYWCETCEIGVVNEYSLYQHMNGRRHRYQLERVQQDAAFLPLR